MRGDQWEVSALGTLLGEGSDEDIRRFFLLLRPPELADLLEQTPEEQRTRVLRLMSAPLASEVLREVEESEREEMLEDLSSAEIAEIVPHLRSDDAADLISELPPDKAERTLSKLDEEEQAEIRELLEYGEDTAGGIMQSEVVTVRHDVTVQDAIDEVRKADEEEVGEVRAVYLVDADGRLVGIASPSDLLHADPAEAVRAVADTDPVKASVDLDQEKIAELVREHDLVALPVVDAGGLLVGQILHDDVADVIEEEASEDIAKMAGADPEELYNLSLWRALRARSGWLLPTCVGGILVAFFMSGIEKGIQETVLAAYIVVVVGMAGGVGTQNSAITIRSLALGRVERASRLVARQLATGVLLGCVYGTLLFCFVMLNEGAGDIRAATAVGVAVLAAMTCGALMGVLVPLLLYRLGVDPAIAASPFIQTANDVAGVGILLLVARLVGLL